MKRGVTWFLRVVGFLVLAAVGSWAQSRAHSSEPVASTQVQMRGLQLPVGTGIRMSLEETVSGRRRFGGTFSGMVTEPVLLEGRTIIPVGTLINGRVAEATTPRRINGRPRMDLRPQQLVLPSGEKLSIRASVVDTGRPDQFDVDDEGRIRIRHVELAYSKREAVIAAAAGAGVGAVAAGLPGAVVGASVGTGAATTHWMLKRRYGQLPAGTLLILELTRPLAMGPPTEMAARH
jgi:hypothetical protein